MRPLKFIDRILQQNTTQQQPKTAAAISCIVARLSSKIFGQAHQKKVSGLEEYKNVHLLTLIGLFTTTTSDMQGGCVAFCDESQITAAAAVVC